MKCLDKYSSIFIAAHCAEDGMCFKFPLGSIFLQSPLLSCQGDLMHHSTSFLQSILWQQSSSTVSETNWTSPFYPHCLSTQGTVSSQSRGEKTSFKKSKVKGLRFRRNTCMVLQWPSNRYHLAYTRSWSAAATWYCFRLQLWNEYHCRTSMGL